MNKKIIYQIILLICAQNIYAQQTTINDYLTNRHWRLISVHQKLDEKDPYMDKTSNCGRGAIWKFEPNKTIKVVSKNCNAEENGEWQKKGDDLILTSKNDRTSIIHKVVRFSNYDLVLEQKILLNDEVNPPIYSFTKFTFDAVLSPLRLHYKDYDAYLYTLAQLDSITTNLNLANYKSLLTKKGFKLNAVAFGQDKFTFLDPHNNEMTIEFDNDNVIEELTWKINRDNAMEFRKEMYENRAWYNKFLHDYTVYQRWEKDTNGKEYKYAKYYTKKGYLYVVNEKEGILTAYKDNLKEGEIYVTKTKGTQQKTTVSQPVVSTTSNSINNPTQFCKELMLIADLVGKGKFYDIVDSKQPTNLTKSWYKSKLPLSNVKNLAGQDILGSMSIEGTIIGGESENNEVLYKQLIAILDKGLTNYKKSERHSDAVTYSFKDKQKVHINRFYKPVYGKNFITIRISTY